MILGEHAPKFDDVYRNLGQLVTAGDPITFVVIALVVASITLLASYLPARRALRIDPVEALRLE